MPMLKQHAIHGNSPCFLLREINLGDFFVKRPRQWFSNFAINKNTASKQKNKPEYKFFVLLQSLPSLQIAWALEWELD